MVCVLLFLQSVLQYQFVKFVKMLCFVDSSMHIQIMCNKDVNVRQKPLHKVEVENNNSVFILLEFIGLSRTYAHMA
jgi:hypothetical protein